jgi:hypothetical protein
MSKLTEALTAYNLAEDKYFTALSNIKPLAPIPIYIRWEIDDLKISMDEKHAELQDIKSGHYI